MEVPTKGSEMDSDTLVIRVVCANRLIHMPFIAEATKIKGGEVRRDRSKEKERKEL